MISRLNQFKSYSLDTKEQLNVIGGQRYRDVYQALYQHDDGTSHHGYLARDTKKSEWVFLYWEDDKLRSICIADIPSDVD